MKDPIAYQVIDIKTQNVVKQCKTRTAATRLADKRDLNYGAVCCVVKPLYAN